MKRKRLDSRAAGLRQAARACRNRGDSIGASFETDQRGRYECFQLARELERLARAEESRKTKNGA